MDFREAFKAHSDWKFRLLNYIHNPDKSLDPAVISKDNRCVLGLWIYGEGQAYNAMPEYEKLRLAHAHFHKIAAQIVDHANQGEKLESEVTLGSNSEYDKVSMEVSQQILVMQRKVEINNRKAISG